MRFPLQRLHSRGERIELHVGDAVRQQAVAGLEEIVGAGAQPAGGDGEAMGGQFDRQVPAYFSLLRFIVKAIACPNGAPSSPMSSTQFGT